MLRKKFKLPMVDDTSSIRVSYTHRSKCRLTLNNGGRHRKKKKLCVKRSKDVANFQYDIRQLRKAKFKRLDSKYYMMIEKTMNNAPDTNVSKVSNNIILVRELDLLLKGKWLNDSVINCYLELLQCRCLRDANNRILFLSSFFYNKLCNNGYSGVKKWTKSNILRRFRNVSTIFDLHKIIFPVHVKDHWYCGCINMVNKSIESYDSLNTDRANYFVIIRNYLQKEYETKKDGVLDMSGWIDVSNDFRYPQQQNFQDCGVFTIKCADWICDKMYPDYAQSDIKYFRERTLIEIILGHTLD